MSGLHGDALGAEDWYNKLLEANVEPDGVVFSTLANANAKSFNADRAKYWLELAEGKGLKLSVQAFISVISAYSNLGNADAAVHHFNKLIQAGYRPNLQCFNALLHAFGSRNDLDAAVHWLENLRQSGLRPDHFTLTAVLGTHNQHFILKLIISIKNTNLVNVFFGFLKMPVEITVRQRSCGCPN